MDSDQNLAMTDQDSNLVLDQDSNLIFDQNITTGCNQIPQNICISLDSRQAPIVTTQVSHRDKLTCPYCLKKFAKRFPLKNHIEIVHKVPAVGYPFQCIYCHASYLQEAMLESHYKVKHKMTPPQNDASLVKKSVSEKCPIRPDKGRIRCVECNLKYSTLTLLRRHLRIQHRLNAIEEKISFPNINAFQKWKVDVERRTSTHFRNNRGPHKSPKYVQRVYVCNRSGQPSVNDLEGKNRINNLKGSTRTGISCTAGMKVNIYQNEVQVEYCLYHYGHGSETTFVQLTDQEQAAVLENVSNGIPIQEQLNDIKETKSSAEHYKAWLIKKRDCNFINCAYASEIYNAGISAMEYVEHWVRICSEMEDSPVLLYRQEALGTKSEDFMLIIMTEFQKHILTVSTKQVVCLDTLIQNKKNVGTIFFTVLIVMDENETAFPVAFCLSRKRDKSTILDFLSCIKESTGPLSCSYFMSKEDKSYFEAWQETMQDQSTWVWSVWSFEDRVRKHMNSLIKDMPTKEATYRQLRAIMECTSQPVFDTMFKNFKKSLLNNEKSEEFGKTIEMHFSSNTEMWACCYRNDLKLSTNIYFEYLHKTLRYCFRVGHKKRLDKFLMTLMKWLRYKMLDRLCNMMDEEKLELAKTTISTFHNMGLDIGCENVISLSEQIWIIQIENEADAYVTREYESCPELCDLRCSDCDICVHMYSCSCIQSLIHANLCQHIHAVVWKFLTPHFSPPVSPVQDNFNDAFDISNDAEIVPDESENLLENILKRMQDVYKQLRANKCKLNKNSLSEVMRMMNKCYQLCSDHVINSNLLSKSTQTDAIPVPSTNQVLKSLSNIVPNFISENHEESSFIPARLSTYNNASNSVSENNENISFMPVTPPVFNTVKKSAAVKKKNITLIPVVSNDTYKIGRKISLIPIVPSDSASKCQNKSKRRCVEEASVSDLSLLNDCSNISFIPVSNSSIITKSDVSSSNQPPIFTNTVLNPALQISPITESSPMITSSSLFTDTYSATNSILKIPCNNISNSLAVADSLSSEKPYLIKCNAPIIRTSKHRIKASLHSKSNSAEKRTDTQKCNIVKTLLLSPLTPNNQPEGSQFFWDSVSKKYFVIENNQPPTSKPKQPSEILLDVASKTTLISSPNEDSETCFTFAQSSVCHSPIVIEASISSAYHHSNDPDAAVLSASSSNHHSDISNDPMLVEASITSPCIVSYDPIVVKASVPSPCSVSHDPIVVKASVPSPCSVSHDPIVVKASVPSPCSVSNDSIVVKASALSVSSSNHHSDISNDPILVKASTPSPCSVSHYPTVVKASLPPSSVSNRSVSHHPIVVKASVASPDHLSDISSDT